MSQLLDFRTHTYGPWRRVNYRVPAEDLGPDEIFEMQNCKIGIGGEVLQRDGFAPFPDNTSQVASAHVTAIGKQRFSAASSANFAIAGTKFVEDVGGTWTDRTNSRTITASAANTWQLVNCNGTLVGHDGISGDSLIKWAASGNIATLDVDSQFTTAKWWEWWDGRVWAGNTSDAVDNIQRSSNLDIETWAGDFYTIGEDCTGLQRLGNEALAIYGEDSITLLTPTQNATIPYRRIGRSGKGTVTGRSIVSVPASGGSPQHLFVRTDGIYRFSGSEAVKISWILDGDRFWSGLNLSTLSSCHAAINQFENEAWFFLPSSGSATMDRIIIYNYVRDSWHGPYLSAAAGNDWNCSATIDGIVHAGGQSDTGKVYRMDDNSAPLNDDDGSGSTTGINAWFVTAAPPPHGMSVKCRWLWATSSFDILGNYDVAISHYAQSIPSGLELINQGGGLDTIQASFAIGVSPITGEDMMEALDTDLTGYGPNMTMRYANSAENETFSIRRAELNYRPLGIKRHSQAGVV